MLNPIRTFRGDKVFEIAPPNKGGLWTTEAWTDFRVEEQKNTYRLKLSSGRAVEYSETVSPYASKSFEDGLITYVYRRAPVDFDMGRRGSYSGYGQYQISDNEYILGNHIESFELISQETRYHSFKLCSEGKWIFKEYWFEMDSVTAWEKVL